jgi:fucose 4-O-acetylase-like acetyltransferase
MSNRVEYIDALRGFTMILVVLGHVEMFSFYEFSHISLIGAMVSSFHMPLFFFISGFLAYRGKKVFDKNFVLNGIFKKTRLLLIPTLFFGMIYTFFHYGGSLHDFIFSSEKLGYWFTISLLEMFLIYYVCHYFTKGNTMKFLLWMSILAFVMFLLKLPFKMNDTLNVIGNALCLHNTFNYFQFFVFGLWVTRYEKLYIFIKKNNCLAIILSLFVGLFYINNVILGVQQTSVTTKKLISEALTLVNGYLGLIIAFVCFDKYRASFQVSTKVGSVLQYIGKRTLDIYVIHYFLLPALPEVGCFFNEQPNVVLELFIGLLLSLMVISVTLVISNILRISDVFGYYLFGAKKGDSIN